MRKYLLVVVFFNIQLFVFLSTSNAQQTCWGLSTCSGTNPYPCTTCGNCTWYAWHKANCVWGVSLPSWGNAKNWSSMAVNAGYTVSSIPAINSIGCYGSGIYGHVVWVEEILPNSRIRVSEMNYDFVSSSTDCIPYGNGLNYKEYPISFFNLGFIISPSKPINDNLEIYSGPRDNPKSNIKIWCELPATGVGNSFTLTSLKVNNTTIGSPSSLITNKRYNSGLNRALFDLDLTSLASSATNPIPNGPYNLEFVLSYGASTFRYLTTSKLYFLKPDDITDISTTDWLGNYYIPKGVKNGLYKGFKDANGNPVFQPYTTLTKGQACKVVVAAMTKLSDVFVVDVSGTPPNGVDINSELFPYIQAAYNKGWLPLANANSYWKQNDPITNNEFVYILYKAFDLANATQNDKPRNYKSKTSITNSSAPYYQQIQQLQGIFLQNTGLLNGFTVLENFASLFVHKASNPSNAYATDIIDGSATVTRGTMAKLMTNLFLWKAAKNGITVSRNVTTAIPIPSYFVIGDKYESTDQPIGNLPTLSPQLLSTYTINDNQTLTLSHTSSSDAANGGIPLYFYWTASGGDTLQALATDFRSVKFKPSTVISQTTYKLYTQCGNTNGKIREYFIDVIVNPTNPALTTSTPTIQASNVQITSATTTSLNVSWTRGNGAYCILTCTPVSSNASHPQDGNIYVGNLNYGSAATINADTRIIYTGISNSINITSLQPNTGYKILVYEYNGNTAVSAKYLTSPISFNTGYTNEAQNTVSNITYFSPVVNGIPIKFVDISSNSNTSNWSVSPFATISNTTSSTTYITFPSVGSYNVTLNVTNTVTGSTDTKTITVVVLDASTNLPDLVIQNMSILTSSVLAGASTSVTLTAINTNSNVPSLSSGFGIQYYISDDQIIDGGDWAVGSEPLEFTNKFSQVVTHTVAVPITFSGSKYILAKIDFNNNVAETNETNNVINASFSIVAALPDLQILSASASSSSFASGVNTTINCTATNTGQVYNQNNSQVLFYISTNNTFSSDDYLLGGNYSVGNIYPNNNLTIPYSLSTPNWWPSGNYYIICYVDAPNDVRYPNGPNDELNESNNTFAIPVTISNSNQPTEQCSNIIITNITSTSVQLNWTNGNGNKRLVTGHKGNGGFPVLPTDGVNYLANSNWNSSSLIYNSTFPSNQTYASRVLYSGTSNQVIITGLSPDTTYYFTVFECNDFGGVNIDYLQTTKRNIVHTHTLPIATLAWSIQKNDPRTIGGTHFISPDSGFVNASWGLSTTIDSGKTWTLNQYLGQNIASYSNIRAYHHVSFLKNNHNVGFLANGSKLYKSNNGGTDWININPTNSFDLINFFPIDGLNIYCIVDNSPTRFLLKTTDGGNTWSTVLTSNNINSLYFITKDTGFVCSGLGEIFKTYNGGLNWTTSNVNNLSQYKISDIYFTDIKTGYFSDYYGKIYKTIDTARTWELKHNYGSSGQFPQIKFFNHESGVIVMGNKFLKTSDEGETWSLIQNSLADPNYSNANIELINENTILMAVAGGLFKTTTSGLSNSIQLLNQPQINLCPNSPITLNYSLTGNFNNGNTIKFELSDSSGSFLSPILLNTVTSNINGTITGILPSNLPSSTNYKIRLTTTNPVSLSNSSNNLQFTSAPILSISGLSNSYPTNATSVPLTASPTGGTFKINGNISSVFNPAILGTGNHIVLYTYISGNCIYTSQKIVNVYIPKTITLGTISPSVFCAGSTFTVPYTLTGIFDSTNIFSVQLSNSTGSFATPIILASVNSNSGGSILSTIPFNSIYGTGYKIRIIGSDGSIVSSLSSSLFIYNTVNPSVSISNIDSVCSNNTILFTSVGLNLGTSPVYQWYVNGLQTGSNSPTFSTSTLATGDVVQLKVSNITGCITTPTIFSQYQLVTVTTIPDVPTITNFDGTLVSSSPNNNQWYFNDVPIVGATNQFYSILNAGMYSVKIFSSPCDTVVSLPFNFNEWSCTGSNIFYQSSNATATNFQWQENAGEGWNNVANNINFSGATSVLLSIHTPPLNWHHRKYRCIADGIIGQEFTLKYINYWTGSIDSDWNNISNWSCNKIPDDYTDVIINSNLTNYPELSANGSCYSIVLAPLTSLKINTGFTLEVKGTY